MCHFFYQHTVGLGHFHIRAGTFSHSQAHTYTHTHTHKLCRTPLEEGSATRKSLNPHNTQQSQERDIRVPGGFELAIPASEWPQSRIIGRAALESVWKNTASSEWNFSTYKICDRKHIKVFRKCRLLKEKQRTILWQTFCSIVFIMYSLESN